VALAALSAGCSSDPARTSLGRVTVNLTDAPGDFEQVNLVITGVSIRQGSDESGGWETLDVEADTYDLLLLRNGVFTRLAIGDVPAGDYDEIRLHLGEGSNLVVDGETHPLIIPSGMSSGYKLKGDFHVPAGGEVELLLDFDAARSIHQTGNGRYMLKPTVRLIVGDVSETTGQIIGRLVPEGVGATVTAIQGTEVVQTTSVEADGGFTLAALVAGSYDVGIDVASSHRDTTILGVHVSAGETTDLGNIHLEAAEGSASAAPAKAGVVPSMR
jgi:hypothetical protein